MILYTKEHTGCCLYDKTDIVQDIKSSKGEELCLNGCTKILFLLKGKVLCNIDGDINTLEEKSFVLLPNSCKRIIQVEEDAEMVTIGLYKKMNFCNLFSIEMLYALKKGKICNNIHCLKINEVLIDFLHCLIKTDYDGLRCEYFLKLKQKEVLYYLRAYYSKQDLFYFFAPVLNGDVGFADLIYKNYTPEINIQKLADKTNYSLSGFKSKFTKVFGISPYKWLKREKAKSIHYDINCTKTTFKEISFQYGFSSQAHFSEFCKNVFGCSPSAMRTESASRIYL